MFKKRNSHPSCLSIRYTAEFTKLVLVTRPILVITVSVWLLNTAHIGKTVSGETSSLGLFPLNLVFVSAKGLVIRLFIFSAPM